MSPKSRHPPGRQPANIKTIAKVLGVSPSTISRAFQADSAISAEMRERVIRAAEQLGYRRDLRGVNLRTGKTFSFCAILASNPSREFGDPASMHLIEGLISGVDDTDFNIVVRPVEGADHRLEAVKEAVLNSRFDGLILDHTEPQDRCILHLLERDVKFVTFGRSELFSQHAFFDIDNEDAAFRATKYLIDQGHERIALIDPPEHYLFASQRLRGYRTALGAAGIAFDPGLVRHLAIGARRVRECVGALLETNNRPTAFVTANEVATLGAVSACRHLPEEDFRRIGIVSRDGTNLFDYFTPAMSSCYFPLTEAGKVLAQTLVAAVDGTPVERLQRIEQVQFIERPRHPQVASDEKHSLSMNNGDDQDSLSSLPFQATDGVDSANTRT